MTARAARLLATAVLAAACGDGGPISAADLLTVTAPEADVVLGRAFPVTVVRAWSRDAQAEDFGEESLFPLVLRLESRSRRESGARVEETLRFRGYAFQPGDVEVAAPSFDTSTSGGTRRAVAGEAFALRVRSALPETDDGTPELPGDVRGGGVPAWAWVAAVASVVAGAVAVVVARRRRVAARASVPVTAAPPNAADVPADRPEWLRAQERLARLRAATPQGREAVEAFHVEASSLLREYVAVTWNVPTERRTTDEVAAMLRPYPGLPPGERARLASCLGACDFVKFTLDVAGEGACRRVAEDIATFLSATREGAR